MYVPVVVFAVISGEPLRRPAWAMIADVAGLPEPDVRRSDDRDLQHHITPTALTPIAIVSGAVPVADVALMAIMCFWVGLSADHGSAPGDADYPDSISR